MVKVEGYVMAPTSRAVQTVLDALEFRHCRPKKSGDIWSAQCPFHKDEIKRLSIGQGGDGSPLLHCEGRCTRDAILFELGLDFEELVKELPQPSIVNSGSNEIGSLDGATVTDRGPAAVETHEAFFNQLHSRCSGLIEIRPLPFGSEYPAKFFKTPREAAEYVASLNGRVNVHVGAATRLRERGTKQDVMEIPGVWADLDSPESVQKLKDFPLRPTLLVETSPGRKQAWWLLRECVLVEHEGVVTTFEGVLKGVAKTLGADPTCAEVARVMRVPGTTNVKKGAECRLVYSDGPRYELQDFFDHGFYCEDGSRPGTDDWGAPVDSEGDEATGAREAPPTGELREACDLLAKHWPPERRHVAALALAGGLLGDGWSVGNAESFVIEVARAADDEEWRDRARAVRDTSRKFQQGEKVTGWGTLAELIGPETTAKVKALLRLAGGGGYRKTNSANYANSASRSPTSTEWDPPTPFYEFDLPSFPTDALPQPLRAFVEAEATATQTPPDLPAMLVLSTVAAATGRKVRIQVKEGYSEPVNIFTVTALPPANRKSAVFSDVAAPLVEFETEQAQEQAPEIRVAQARRDIAEQRLNQAQKEAARHFDDPTKLEEVERLARELAKMKVPASPRLIADDTTPEKLSALLAQQDGRMAVMSPEGGVFDLMAGRYSQNNSPNFEVYLKGHAGDTLRVDRMGRAEYVPRPALTLGLAVQPKVLEGLTSETEFRGRGLLGRFLYSFPKSLVGHRDVDAPPVPAEARTDYYRCIARLVRFTPDTEETGLPKEHVLTLDPGARSQMRDAEIWIEEQLREFGELGSMPDWGGKWLGAVARIAALLHLAEQAAETDSWATPVVRKTVERALTIGKYLIPHAKAAYAAMDADPEITAAQHILSWIRHRALESFTKRDAFEGTKGRFRKVVAMEPALVLLCDHGYIRERAVTNRPGPGRKPSPTYDVNPRWLSQISHNSQKGEPRPGSANSASQTGDQGG